MNDLKSIARIAIITFASAFFAALTFTGIPSTLAEAKAVVAPALMAALIAEIVYLRKVFAKALADAAAGSLGPAPTAPPAATTVTTTTTTPPAAS